MNKKDDDVINLRATLSEPEFKINSIDNEEAPFSGNLKATSVSELEEAAMKPHDKVKVKFDKFVNLIATHAYEEIIEKHLDEDVIISTNLLTDLANAHEEKEDKKMPLVFIVGILLGVILTYFLVKN